LTSDVTRPTLTKKTAIATLTTTALTMTPSTTPKVTDLTVGF
jgi:hypothetical protein